VTLDWNVDSHENIDPAATPPSSPRKLSTPRSTRKEDKVTPLHRRFLKEVDMSPATPPSSPSRERPGSPTKGRESPDKGCESPTKQKLEVGQNGFYFSCELPLSKVTPKKTGTSGGGRERVRTPSPTKKIASSVKEDTISKEAPRSPNKKLVTPGKLPDGLTNASPKPTVAESPKKSTPARLTFGTPSRKVATPDLSKQFSNGKVSPPKTKTYHPAEGTSKTSTSVKASFGTPLRKVATPASSKTTTERKTSPTKSIKLATSPTKSIKLASKFAHKDPSSAVPTLRISPECLKDVTKADGTNGGAATYDTSKLQAGTVTEQRRTKPSRESSFDIGDMMVGLKGLLSKPRDEREEDGKSAPPTPLRRAAERMNSGVPAMKKKDGESVEPKGSGAVAATELSTDVGKENGIALPIRQKDEHTPHSPSLFRFIPNVGLNLPQSVKKNSLEYPPLLFPPPATTQSSSPGIKAEHMLQRHQKHVNWRDSTPISSPSKHAQVPASRRAGTDPAVFLAMRKEMDTMETSMRRFFGFEYSFSGRENAFELPAMANSLLDSVSQAPTTIGPKGTLSRTTSNTSATSTASSMSVVRASMLLDPEDPNATAAAKQKPRWPYVGKTPAQLRRERLAAAKEKDGKDRETKPAQLTRDHVHSNRKANSKPGAAKATSRNQAKAISTARTPTKLRQTTSWTRGKALTTPGQSKRKTATGTISRGLRPSIFDSPSSATDPPPSSRKSTTLTPHPNPPSNPPAAPRPREKKFAGALDIANRVAEWNSEDRKRAALALEKPKDDDTPSKQRTKGSEEEESHTPPDSPTYITLSSPLRTLPLNPDVDPPAATPPPKRPSRTKPPTTTTTTSTTTTPNPTRSKPNTSTSTPRNPALARLRNPAPRTPASRIARLDPNAFRTPSKEIEGALDRAIDRRIEEEGRSGRVWTVGGEGERRGEGEV
tara:strand:- start:14003 stop:16828 length:2826 start_codon:yes stop_codon:yes gene_type:complete